MTLLLELTILYFFVSIKSQKNILLFFYFFIRKLHIYIPAVVPVRLNGKEIFTALRLWL